MKASTFLRLILTAATGIAFAISVQAKPSDAPSLQPPPKHGAWKISYQYENPKPKRPPRSQIDGSDLADHPDEIARIESRDFTVNGNIARCVTRYSNGTRTTAYILGSIGVRENRDKSGDLFIENYGLTYFRQTDFRSHFSELEWIRPQYYRGVTPLNDVMCHHFVESEETPAPDSEEHPTPGEAPSAKVPAGREAWISSRGYPMQTRKRGVISTYRFKPVSDVPTLSVPTSYRAKAQAYLDALNPREAGYSGKR